MKRRELRRARRRVRAAQRALSGAYRLELDVDAGRHLLSPDEARAIVPGAPPRSGVLACEADGALHLGLYLDPADVADPATVAEETSHFVCLAWHASQGRPVSALVLELQSEVDRYVLARLEGRDGLAHFEGFVWDAWVADDPQALARYQRAHVSGARYCRGLQARYPRRADLPALLAELRRFYRAPGPWKLGWAASGRAA